MKSSQYFFRYLILNTKYAFSRIYSQNSDDPLLVPKCKIISYDKIPRRPSLASGCRSFASIGQTCPILAFSKPLDPLGSLSDYRGGGTSGEQPTWSVPHKWRVPGDVRKSSASQNRTPTYILSTLSTSCWRNEDLWFVGDWWTSYTSRSCWGQRR